MERHTSRRRPRAPLAYCAAVARPPATIRLGDVEVPRIGLGTNRLQSTAEGVELVRAAVAAGIRHVDTAHLYTRGGSEQAIGAALAPPPDGCVVATKGGFGGAGQGRPEVLRAQLDESLRRLRTETIELYYLHRVDPETPLEESLRTLAEARERGAIRHVGLSEVGIAEIERARRVVPIAAVQNQYNASERKHDEVVDYCAQEQIAFVSFYPLRVEGGPVLAEIAARHEATEAQVLLAWLLSRSPAIVPIPGTLSLDHVRENLAALELDLDDGELEALNER